MASVYDLKPRFQALLRPLCAGLATHGVTANQVTVAAVLLSVAAGAAVATAPAAAWPYLLLPPVLLVRMALNAIDGMLAREHGMKSRLGALLNEIGDVVSDAALILPLGLHPAVPGALVAALAVLAATIEMIGVVAVTVGASRRYDGPFGKSDRAVAIGLLAVGLAAGVVGPALAAAYLGLCLALGVVTVYLRGARALAEGAPS